jgi:hypothetical protein
MPSVNVGMLKNEPLDQAHSRIREQFVVRVRWFEAGHRVVINDPRYGRTGDPANLAICFKVIAINTLPLFNGTAPNIYITFSRFLSPMHG